MDQNRRICDCENVAQNIIAETPKNNVANVEGNHRNQVRPLLCTKLARAPCSQKLILTHILRRRRRRSTYIQRTPARPS